MFWCFGDMKIGFLPQFYRELMLKKKWNGKRSRLRQFEGRSLLHLCKLRAAYGVFMLRSGLDRFRRSVCGSPLHAGYCLWLSPSGIEKPTDGSFPVDYL